jgi:hypothetical protein
MAVREPTCEKRVSVLTAHQKQDATPDLTPQTPADVPVAKTTLGRQIRVRIGVTVVWHRQQSIPRRA